MVLFLHALQICAIASISVTISGYVLITAEVEEFKNLASTFLSPDLADKLTALVAESAQGYKNQQVGENVPDVSFRAIENTVKDEFFKSYNTPFNILSKKVTYSPTSYNKRYKTVKNHDNKQNQTNEHYISRQSNSEKTKLKPLYKQYTHMDDYAYHNKNKNLHYAELKLNDRNKIYSYSQETRFPKDLFDEIIHQNVTDVDVDEMFKKLDYTETKLGEWNYNPNLLQIPVSIKNLKTGYTYYYAGNNKDTNADIKEPILEEDYTFTANSFIEVTEKNIMNNKPIIDSKTTNNEPLSMENHGTYNQYFLEPEEEESQKIKPEALSVEEINKYKTLLIGSKNQDNDLKKNREKQVIERDTFNQQFLGSKHKMIPKEKSKTLPKQYDDIYGTRILESKNQVSGERQSEFQQVTEQEHKTQQILKYIQKGIPKEKKKMPLKNEHYMDETNMSVRNKNKFSKTKKSKDKNEKQFGNLESSIIDKEENEKPQKQLIEENDMYEKYALNYKTEDSYERKVSHKEIDDSNKKLEIKKEFSHKSAAPYKRNKSNTNEKNFLKNEKQRFNLKASKFKENSKTGQSIKTLAENLGDSLSDDREVKPEDVKAKTEYLYDYDEVTSTTKDIKAITENVQDNLDDSVDVKGKSTKRFLLKGTVIPKRDFYKMSTPDYYNKLPKIAQKYDFEEPLPEQDRERVKEKYVKREPSLINKKIRLI